MLLYILSTINLHFKSFLKAIDHHFSSLFPRGLNFFPGELNFSRNKSIFRWPPGRLQEAGFFPSLHFSDWMKSSDGVLPRDSASGADLKKADDDSSDVDFFLNRWHTYLIKGSYYVPKCKREICLPRVYGITEISFHLYSLYLVRLMSYAVLIKSAYHPFFYFFCF